MARLAWISSVLLCGATGCFADPPISGGNGSSGTEAPTSSGEAEDTTGLPTTSPETTDEEPASSSSTSEGESVDTSDTSDDAGCTPGELGCACEAEPVECVPGGVCERGICVEPPGACVVSYGGLEGTVEVSVVRVDAGGQGHHVSDASLVGAHDPPGDAAGQDMLTACGDHIYAALNDDAAIVVLELEADGTIAETSRAALPAETGAAASQLRALECPRPSSDFLLAIALVESPGGGTDVRLHALVRNPTDGSLSGGVQPVNFPVATEMPPRRVRSAWSATRRHGYVIYDDPTANGSGLFAFSMDSNTGAVSVLSDQPNSVLGIQARLGALEVGRGDGFLALVGAQGDNRAGAGAAVRFGLQADHVPDPAFVMLSDLRGAGFFAGASSVVFPDSPGAGARGVVASSVGVGVVDFSDNTPGVGPMLDAQLGGPVTAMTAQNDSMVILANGDSVAAFEPNVGVGQVGPTLLDTFERPRVLEGYTASVAVRCTQ